MRSHLTPRLTQSYTDDLPQAHHRAEQPSTCHTSAVHVSHAPSACHTSAVHVSHAPSTWQVAPDFFEYFEAMAPLLYRDPTLLTVSAYNDNGQAREHDYRF